MVRHHRALAWEKQLKQVFDSIDNLLEERYGDAYSLHPARPPRGQTANPEHDGLFLLGGKFTPGYGSATGPGYVVELRLSTLEKIPDSVRQDLAREVAGLLRERLAVAFPGRELHVTAEGAAWKIHGDLSLGEA